MFCVFPDRVVPLRHFKLLFLKCLRTRRAKYGVTSALWIMKKPRLKVQPYWPPYKAGKNMDGDHTASARARELDRVG